MFAFVFLRHGLEGRVFSVFVLEVFARVRCIPGELSLLSNSVGTAGTRVAGHRRRTQGGFERENVGVGAKGASIVGIDHKTKSVHVR